MNIVKEVQMNNFTYPVLTEYDSSYNEKCKFEVSYISHSFDEENMNIGIEIKLSSDYLKSLIEQEKAYLLIRVCSSIFTLPIISKGNTQIVNFPIEKLLDNDSICVQAYLLAKEVLSISYTREMRNIYKSYRNVSVGKNAKLAISNMFKLYYQKYEDSFISMEKTPQLNGKGIRINMEDSNSIMVKVGTDYADAYAHLSGKEVLADYISVDVLHYTLQYINTEVLLKKNGEKYVEKKWFEGYKYLFAKAVPNKDLMDIITSGEDLDVDEVFGYTQKMLDNKLEDSLIKLKGSPLIEKLLKS